MRLGKIDFLPQLPSFSPSFYIPSTLSFLSQKVILEALHV